jgi:ATP-dependent exoDNAse (exonuclease V) beta subunit
MSDTAARASALDTTRSFIVQAPAGSGKTELLIQRYLALLESVHQPEQVVAITFTRKAAAEMRARVLRALRAAAAGTPSDEAHEQRSFELAAAVIARDTELGWQVLTQPQRLRIDTLDAFNGWLARRLPVLADGAAAAGIAEKADELYRHAARRTLAALGSDDQRLRDGLRLLLRDAGNDFDHLERLLAALLPRRDQWLRPLTANSVVELRALLEGALQRLVDDELAAVAALADGPLVAALAPLLRHAASAAGEGLGDALAPWLALERPPPAGPLALAAWRGVAALLLTKKGEWRRRVSRPEGFGPEHTELRDRLRALLAALEANEPLRAALEVVSSLPDPCYTDAQLRSLEALQIVLVRLVAELKVTFAEQRLVDFVELALAAQRALGHVDEPSELLLALDRRIQHLLVDEFQDTSQSQLRLLELLTAGWQPGDGRTLFLVGDPMQSIYRFRDADMSLFLLAKQRGIGSISLHSLTLQRNFRSAPAVVSWVNSAFAHVFPAADDIASGRAGFHASEATRSEHAGQFVREHAVAANALAEAARVADILDEEHRRDPEQSIAVLVQSRTHLEGLRELLRERGLPVHAIEIDTLAEQSVAQDLLGLTRALLHLDDRIAWLAVLHAPWCGLTFADLHALCHDSPAAIWDLLRDPTRITRLSADGQSRALRAAATLGAALARREQLTLTRWIEHTWLALGGEACLDAAAQRLAAEQFFVLLANAERGGDLADPAALERALEVVQPQADPPRERGVEIMTMHRAKGLEFDTVVLLGLAREPRPDDPRALQWMLRTAHSGSDDLIMVPAAAVGDAVAQRLVDFVRGVERERDLTERARLLYVATTRARERLHLVWQLPAGAERPPPHTLLAHLWPVVARDAPPATAGVDDEPPAITPVLRRLVAPTSQPTAPKPEPEPALVPRPEFVWAGASAVHVGTVVHRYLQRIADDGLARWNEQRIANYRGAFVRELELLGAEPRELEPAAALVGAALARALADPHGRWVLGSHEDARAELRLTLRAGAALEHVRLDRTFVADGRRWIVDFKTSSHEGGELDAFLESEVARYAPQLERYASAIAALDALPVQLALYFPLLGALRAWPAAVTATRST